MREHFESDGRSFTGYGRTNLPLEHESLAGPTIARVIVALAMGAIAYFVWQFCR